MNNRVEIYADDIDLYLREYCESRHIEDDKKITSSMWAAALMYINQHIFKGKDLLRHKNTFNNEPYDLDKVLALLGKYIFLCSDHNQRVCVDHFCLLSGIDRATIYSWGSEGRRSGDKRAKQVYITLLEHSMMAADDLMVSRSGVNSIAYRNAVQERYNAFWAKQENKAVVDATDLRERLGITEQLALPDQGETEQKAKVSHVFDTINLLDFNM